jgi:hypothetical protein
LEIANSVAVTNAFLFKLEGDANTKEAMMGTSIEYQKLMTEIVYINLPGPTEPNPGMTGGELLYGFLAELHYTSNPEVKSFITSLCLRWNVHYRETGG